MDIVQSSHYLIVSRISDSYQDKGVHFFSAFFPTQFVFLVAAAVPLNKHYIPAVQA